MRKILLVALLVSGAAAAEPGTLIKESELKAKPFADAGTLAVLKNKTALELQSRQGAWVEVKTTSGQSGWVRMLNVRTGSGKSGDSGVGAFARLFKTGSSGNTVSTGVKGLSAEDLRSAAPNAAEAEKLRKQATTGNDARQSAKQAKLQATSIAYLPAGD